MVIDPNDALVRYKIIKETIKERKINDMRI